MFSAIRAPIPGEERGVALRRGQDRQHRGGQQAPARRAALRPGSPEAPPFRVAVLGDEQYRAAPLTAEREALYQPQEREQQGRGDADRRVGRQQPDGERGGPHHDQADHE
jgi:hypothetical protein